MGKTLHCCFLTMEEKRNKEHLIILVRLEKLRGILPVTMDISFLFIITVFSKKLKLIKVASYNVALYCKVPLNL